MWKMGYLTVLPCKVGRKNRERRRLPFVSAVASLCSSAVVARALLVIYPLKTRHHDASYHNTTINDSTTTVYGQPVNQSTADNHTTIAQQGYRGRTAGVPRAHRRRTVDIPQTQTQTQTQTTTTSTTTTMRRHTADAPQMHCRRRQQQQQQQPQ